MLKQIASLLFLGLIFTACNADKNKSDSVVIEENVKKYFFLDDSAKVNVTITDTIKREELNELLGQIDTNTRRINQDLDTLSIMIDDRAYRVLDYRKEIENTNLLKKAKYKDSLRTIEKEWLQLRLKQAELLAKKEGFRQTNRILLHLQRSAWADVAGFNIDVVYMDNGNEVALDLLLDADFRIID